MGKERVLAFSDGVLAIAITIMVLELEVPTTSDPHALLHVLPVFLSYVLSFIYVGIYWNNHHHLMHKVGHVTGGMLWANLHLLFWLSLFPFATAWMGQNHFDAAPAAVYGFVLLMAAIAYLILSNTIVTAQGPQSELKAAIGSDVKGKLSIVLYAVAIPIALFIPWIAELIYAIVAGMWLIPDRRIERNIKHTHNTSPQ
ncbi:MAG: DUF1211 domain-containing protein [Bradyrhizobiaceae bacterium]|nr:DUF1211 domain-containing protein [Bradyrhizobiaceae bacterium]